MTVKRLNHYLGPADERAFSIQLKAAFPSLRIRDGERWPAGQDPHRDRIDECVSSTVYLWNPDLFPDPPIAESAGWCHGASTGYVIQFMRSIPVHRALRMGQMGASFDPANEPGRRYTEKVFRILKGLQTHQLEVVEQASGKVTAVNRAIVVSADGAALVMRGAVLAAPAGITYRPVPL